MLDSLIIFQMRHLWFSREQTSFSLAGHENNFTKVAYGSEKQLKLWQDKLR